MAISTATSFAKQVIAEFTEDEAVTRAAGLAFYAALALAPLVLLFVAITGFLGEGSLESMYSAVESNAGTRAGEAVRSIAEQGTEDVESKPGISMLVSVLVILYSASGVVAALQAGLNRIWDVKPAPDAGWFDMVRKRVLSLGMIVALAFLLFVSTIATTVMDMVLPAEGWAWRVATMLLSLGIFTVLFAAVYKILPDVEIAWADVWTGAIVTSVLFAVGRVLISLYISRAGFDDSYGAAGSLVAMLVWVYYTSLIVYLGAEVTQVNARWRNREIRPNSHAVRFKEVIEDPGAGPGVGERAQA